MSTDSASFPAFWATLLLRPRTFFRRYLAGAHDRPPYFVPTMLLFCVGYGIERVDKQLNKAEMKGRLEQLDWLNHWPSYWITATVGGLIGGYILYLVAGWFYHLRLRWSGASPDTARARHLYLYSSVIVSIACIAYALATTLLLPRPQAGDADSGTAGGFGMLLVCGCLFYSVFVSYCGVTTITDADPAKARVWFLILPLLLYGIALVALVSFFAFF